MKTLDDININQWFMTRELAFVPDHFTQTTIDLTTDSHTWIREKLSGRYALITAPEVRVYYDGLPQQPAFEDSKEAMLYILTWG